MKLVTRSAAAALCLVSLVAALPAVRAEDGKPAAAGTPATGSKFRSAKIPADVDGVLLDDGRQIEGEFEEIAGQKWVVKPKGGGEALTVWVTQIIVAEKGGEVEQRGEESEAALVWRHAVKADAAAKKAAGGEEAAKAAMLDGLAKGVAWCAKREFVTAATSMLTEIAKLDPSRKADCEKRQKELMPEGFFFADKPDAVALWVKWADALLPSSAQFVHPEDEDIWNHLDTKPWNDGATLAFRTTNVILYIRDMDPMVCGKALRLAEQTARMCQIFLNEGEPDVVTGDSSRLEIRIHKNRADYLAEEDKDGKKKADEWSAGFFSPWDLTSHFYVDQLDRKKGGGSAPDIAELTRVLTHEFTHHYVTARWIPRIITARGATQQHGGPGYWVVEGIAEFVQNQSHRMNDPEPRFDDDNVRSNLECAAMRRSGVRVPQLALENFIDMSQGDMRALDDMGKHLFYVQASALSHFFLQKKGPEMRRKYVRYVSDHYAGIPHKPGWQYFGYASAAALEQDFDAFLRGLAPRK